MFQNKFMLCYISGKVFKGEHRCVLLSRKLQINCKSFL